MDVDTRNGYSMSTEYKLANPMIYTWLKEKAKQLRQYPTEAETILWEGLRNKKSGFVFKRQYIIDEYIVDFICLARKLIVEVDGKYHSKGEQQELDSIREQRLKAMGFRLLRFTNEEIMCNNDSVLTKIKQALNECI